ncbi:MAG: thioredoxin-disulfide reductase [Bullifex sp.]
MYDCIIAGAGPAGLSAAIYACRFGHSVLIIEPLAPGGQLMYIDRIENYPASAPVSGFSLADSLQKQAEGFGAEIVYDEVTSVAKTGNVFTVTCSAASFEARSVIICTGAHHRKLGIPGEDRFEGKGVSYCATCDGPFYRGKDVLVVGGGDTALTEALYLSGLCSSVTLIHRRGEFRAQDLLVRKVKETPNIRILMNQTLSSVNGDTKISSVTLEDGSSVTCDGVFIFAGIIPSSEAFRSTVNTDPSGFIITNERLETSVKGIFAAGDVRTTLFRQVITAASDGALAAHSAHEYLSENNG